MSKTIEQAAREYAEAMCPIGDYCGGVYDEQRNSDLPIYTDDAKSVLEWLFTKPLSQRLTDEERERVRKMYDNAMEVFCDTRDIEAKEYAMCRLNTLEEIFGKELFGEE